MILKNQAFFICRQLRPQAAATLPETKAPELDRAQDYASKIVKSRV
jgi:hypothetical protein